MTRGVPGGNGLAHLWPAGNNSNVCALSFSVRRGGLVRIYLLLSYLLLWYEFRSLPFGFMLMLVIPAVFVAAVIAGYWIRRQRLQTWASADGRIESCTLGLRDRGMQVYHCIYLFSVEGVRQAGEVTISDRSNRLEEIKAALVGQPVTVRYDPGDCTRSILEETQINGWSVR